MWLCSSVPWESSWGGDRQPKVGKEQLLLKLWPAGRKVLEWLLQVLSGFVRALELSILPASLLWHQSQASAVSNVRTKVVRCAQ